MTKFTPDKYQKQVIEHDINKPLLVTAGPGSGKTAVITERIKFLLDKKTKPKIFFCTQPHCTVAAWISIKLANWKGNFIARENNSRKKGDGRIFSF